MAVTSDGLLKPVTEFIDAERWWCDDEFCKDEPPHVHCMMHRHNVDLFTGRSV